MEKHQKKLKKIDENDINEYIDLYKPKKYKIKKFREDIPLKK